MTQLNFLIAEEEASEIDISTEPPPINESISGVNPDKLWTTFGRHINGTEALYSGADYRAIAAG
jgi:hypothetical protein